MSRCPFALLTILFTGMPLAGDSSKCAVCHPAETTLHLQSRMAHAMTAGLSSAFAKRLPDQPLRESADGFQFSYRPVEGGLQVTAQRGNHSASGVIEWVLGAGAQGQTPLVRVGESLFESRVSYFTRLDQYGITIGQPGGKSANATAALGLKESHKDAESCLLCHATGVSEVQSARAAPPLLQDGNSLPSAASACPSCATSLADLEPVIPGIQCERCHAGSEEHAANHTAVANPGKMSPREQLNVCGACHRLTPPVDDTQPENVRFQPLRLMKSRCFASGKLACTSCHAAHLDARRNDAAFYNEKCNACHTSMATGQHRDDRKQGDCIGCHMPVVQLHPALKFTDHFIRVIADVRRTH